MAVGLTWLAFWVLLDARDNARSQVKELTSAQQCYRTAAADTTAAAARVQVDLAEFVVIALEKRPTDGLAEPMARHAVELSKAIEAQMRALENCNLDSGT